MIPLFLLVFCEVRPLLAPPVDQEVGGGAGREWGESDFPVAANRRRTDSCSAIAIAVITRFFSREQRKRRVPPQDFKSPASPISPPR